MSHLNASDHATVFRIETIAVGDLPPLPPQATLSRTEAERLGRNRQRMGYEVVITVGFVHWPDVQMVDGKWVCDGSCEFPHSAPAVWPKTKRTSKPKRPPNSSLAAAARVRQGRVPLPAVRFRDEPQCGSHHSLQPRWRRDDG